MLLPSTETPGVVRVEVYLGNVFLQCYWWLIEWLNGSSSFITADNSTFCEIELRCHSHLHQHTLTTALDTEWEKIIISSHEGRLFTAHRFHYCQRWICCGYYWGKWLQVFLIWTFYWVPRVDVFLKFLEKIRQFRK